MSTLSQRFEGEEEACNMPLLHVEQERMHARLEQYLVEAEAGLKSLTPAEQRAELAELRSHLGALMEAEQELGATPEEAAINTLKQFGSAREVTDKIVQVHQTPGQQFRGALIVSVLGALLSYAAGQILTWSQVHELESGGRIVSKFGLSTFLPVLAPLFLGTLVGKLFPRAYRARVPVMAAAVTWILTSILTMLGSPIRWNWLDYSFDLAAWQAWWKTFSNPLMLFYFAQPAIVFLTLAWTAQSVARRPARQGGLAAWGKDLLSRIPDTWVGALGAYALISTGISLVRLPLTLWGMLQATSKPTQSVSPAEAIWSLVSLIGISAAVGHVLPKRGWMAPLIQAICLALGMVISRLSPQDRTSPSMYGFMVLMIAGGLVATLAAYFVGRKRLAAQ